MKVPTQIPGRSHSKFDCGSQVTSPRNNFIFERIFPAFILHPVNNWCTNEPLMQVGQLSVLRVQVWKRAQKSSSSLTVNHVQPAVFLH